MFSAISQYMNNTNASFCNLTVVDIRSYQIPLRSTIQNSTAFSASNDVIRILRTVLLRIYVMKWVYPEKIDTGIFVQLETFAEGSEGDSRWCSKKMVIASWYSFFCNFDLISFLYSLRRCDEHQLERNVFIHRRNFFLSFFLSLFIVFNYLTSWCIILFMPFESWIVTSQTRFLLNEEIVPKPRPSFSNRNIFR